MEVGLNKKQNPKYSTVKFMDSFLMLPISLKKAAQQFKVESKGDFDFNLIDQCITPADLEMIREKLQEYNIRDCRVLWEVLALFTKQCAEEFNINILNNKFILLCVILKI